MKNYEKIDKNCVKQKFIKNFHSIVLWKKYNKKKCSVLKILVIKERENEKRKNK